MNILLVDDHPMTVQGYENALMKDGLQKDHLNLLHAIAKYCLSSIDTVFS